MKITKLHGTLVMIASATGLLLTFLLSSGWNSELQFVANVLYVMRIQLFGGEYGQGAPIDFPAKYALEFFVVAFAIGLGIYFARHSSDPVSKQGATDGK